MPAFKRRAFKTIQVEMCGHELDIPKYALEFFDKLREASMLIDTGDHATLLQTIVTNKVQPINPSTSVPLQTGWKNTSHLLTKQVVDYVR